LGPRFEVNLMRTSLSRLIMFSMFQLSMLIYVSDLNEDDQYTSILRKVLSADFLISSPDSH
jgi:hypothetical protein